MTFWSRKVEIEYAGIRITEPKIDLELKYEVGTATLGTVSIFNLSKDTERQLDEADGNITISAGYEDTISQIFSGTVQRIEKLRQQLHRVVKLHLTSSALAIERLGGATNSSYEGVNDVRDIVSTIITQDMQLTHGPLDDIPADLTVKDWSWNGTSHVALLNLLGTSRVRWHQDADGVVQFNLPRKKSAVANAVKLSVDNGMLESPAVTDEGVRIKSLLNPTLRVGTVIDLRSEFTNGQFKVVSLQHTGSNWDGTFSTEMVANPV